MWGMVWRVGNRTRGQQWGGQRAECLQEVCEEGRGGTVTQHELFPAPATGLWALLSGRSAGAPLSTRKKEPVLRGVGTRCH